MFRDCLGKHLSQLLLLFTVGSDIQLGMEEETRVVETVSVRDCLKIMLEKSNPGEI